MKILIAKEKHSTRYFDASTNELLHRACVKLLKERLEADWYHAGTPPDEHCYMSIEAIDKLPAHLQSAARRTNTEIKQASDRHAVAESFLKSVQEIIQIDKPLLGNRRGDLMSWLLLEHRNEYEYEKVRIESIEAV